MLGEAVEGASIRLARISPKLSAGNGPPFELLAEHGRLAIWRRFVATDRSTLLDEGARRA
jgi:hypothetical protein